MRWTVDEFAAALPGRGENEDGQPKKRAAKRTVEGWLAGAYIPRDPYTFPAILRTLFGPSERDGGESRQSLRAVYEEACRAADAAVLEETPRRSDGYIAMPAGSLIGFDTAPAADDLAAASDPGFQAEHAEVAALAKIFAEDVHQPRHDNALGAYPLLRRGAKNFVEAMALPATALPHWEHKAHAACVMLAASYDADRRFSADKSYGEPLPADLHSTLGVILELAAPLLLKLPSVQRKDRSLRDFRRRMEVSDSRAVAIRLRTNHDLTVEASDLLRDLLDTATADGAQGDKASSQLVATILNTLLLGGAGLLSTVGQFDPALVERLRALFCDVRGPIERLIETEESLLVQAALRHALAVARSNEDKKPGASQADGVIGKPGSAPRFRPPLDPLAQWREPVPGLPEEAWPDMVTIPAGNFLMGAPEDEEGRDDDERPQREVRVLRPFALARVAVTFAMWDAAVAAGFQPKGAEHPEDQGWGRGQRPVIHVSWYDAQAYCAWLNRFLDLAEYTYRLPSEAEWEYSCRANAETVSPFSFGATITAEQANHDARHVYGAGKKGEYRGRTVPVGSLPANCWGLREMHGNIWEWIEDEYGIYPNFATNSEPREHSNAAHRVLRGGSWDYKPNFLRSAGRGRGVPGNRGSVAGFRIARTLL